jgi:hypothetical protein
MKRKATDDDCQQQPPNKQPRWETKVVDGMKKWPDEFKNSTAFADAALDIIPLSTILQSLIKKADALAADQEHLALIGKLQAAVSQKAVEEVDPMPPDLVKDVETAKTFQNEDPEAIRSDVVSLLLLNVDWFKRGCRVQTKVGGLRGTVTSIDTDGLLFVRWDESVLRFLAKMNKEPCYTGMPASLFSRLRVAKSP